VTATGYGALSDLTRVAKSGDTMTGTLVLTGTLPEQVPAGAGSGKIWTSDALGNGSWQAAASSLQPWQFDVMAYGAKPDGRFVPDGAMQSGSPLLNCPNTTPFTSADVGKYTIVPRVGASGVTSLVAQIQAYNSPSQVTLNANATVTASGVPMFWGSDNTSAFTSAETAANAYAQANAFGIGAVTGPPGVYGLFGPLKTGAPTFGNAPIPLHIPGPPVNKVTMHLSPYNYEYAATGAFWQQTVPQCTGMTLVSGGVFSSQSAQGNNITANGNPAVIGGPTPTNDYGTSPDLKYSNMNFVMRGVTIITPLSANGWNYCAVDLTGVAQCTIRDVNISVTGTYVGGDFNNPVLLSGGSSKGILLPANGNNDILDIENLSIWGGYTFNIMLTEHADVRNLRSLYAWSAMAVVGNYFNSAGAGHAVKIDQCSVEGCIYNGYILGQGAAGIGPYIDIDQMDTESPAPRWRDDNSGALASARGTVKIVGLYTASSIQTDANTGLNILNGQQAQGPVAALSYSLGTPFQNTYWQPVRVSLAGGNVTAIKTSALMGGPGGVGVPALTNMTPAQSGGGALPYSTFDLGPGAWMEIDGSVKPTTNQWSVGVVG